MEFRLLAKKKDYKNAKFSSVGIYNVATKFNREGLERERRRLRMLGYSTKLERIK